MNPFTALKNLSLFHFTSFRISHRPLTSLHCAIHIHNSLHFTSLHFIFLIVIAFTSAHWWGETQYLRTTCRTVLVFEDVLVSICQVSICQVSICQVSICQVSICQVSICQVSTCQVSICRHFHPEHSARTYRPTDLRDLRVG